MADISELELDALWEEFHRAVNMTSQELAAWLLVEDVAEGTEPPPDQVGVGEQVLEMLRKRRTDLTDEDVRVMYRVVDTVEAEEGSGAEPAADDERRRHRLMRLGHDPLKCP